MTPDSPFDLDQPIEIIAHRGYSARAPENTIAALLLALDAGATAVEFDLHTTTDGIPVLLHDETLDRTTDGQGEITAIPARDLTGLDAGSWFDHAFADEPLPTLAAALDAIRSRVTTVFCELKGVRAISDVQNVVAVTRDADLLDRTVFISMNWALLDAVRAHAPEALIGPIVEHEERIDSAFARVADDPRSLLDFDARILLAQSTLTERADALGVPLAVWTVDQVDQASRLLELGVRRITTNQVGRMLAWAETISSQ